MLAGLATDIATAPDHILMFCGLNDRFNHGGAPIPLSTTISNYNSYFAGMKAARPNVRFHVVSALWYLNENWPDGAGAGDATTQLLNAALRNTIVAGEPKAEYLDIRTPIYSIDAPLYNPGHLTNGVLTQGAGDGTHPNKPLGQQVISKRIFDLVTFGL